MRRIVVLMLTLCMVFVLAACGTQSDESASGSQADTSATVSEDSNTSENDEQSDENKQTAAADSNDNTPDYTAEENNDSPANTDSSVLVVYFSCTGNTKGLAEKIASSLDADIYEIVPEQPYTDDDLNYNNSSSRSTQEQNDDACRPAISGSAENMESYDTLIIGYPIWWGQAPKIMYTFVESYDLSGKTIVPFCTSGSSGVGSSATNLQDSAPDANWLEGTRLSTGVSDSDVENWLSGLGLK